MAKTMISIENLSKVYRMGAIGSGSLRDDFTIWWANLRGKENPLLRVGESAERIEGEYLWALRNINLEVKEGEILGIIGENGAGKSTLLKILSRITSPTAGEFHLGGRLSSLIEIGTGFHGELTGRENIYLNGAIHGMTRSEIDRRLDEIIDFAGVGEYIDTPVKRYSSGMYVRLGFAVAAHLNSEILLVDEVLAVGDAEFQKKALGKIGNVAKKGRTVLFVSHNMSAIRNVCSNCIILEKGKPSEKMPVDFAVDRYLNKVIEEFEPTIILPKGEPGMPGEGKTLHILSMEGTPNVTFKLRQPWKVIYQFEIFKYSKQVVAGFYLTMNGDTTSVINYLSSPQDLDSGIYQVEFIVDEHFAANTLSFLVFLFSGERTIYWERNVGGVSISEDFVGEQPRLFQAGNGVILSKQNETIKKIIFPDDIS